jgi:hypothetical protein
LTIIDYKKNFPDDVIRKVVTFVIYFINLKETEEIPFWGKVNKKHLKDPSMTAAVKKKMDAGLKKFVEGYFEAVYGAIPEDFAQHYAQNKLVEANRNAVLNLYNELGLNAEQIAKTLKFDLPFVQETLANFNKKA